MSYNRDLNTLKYTQQQLNHFKADCYEDIDSKRSFEKILNLNDLITILIKRDCTSKVDYILKILSTNEIQRTPKVDEPLEITLNTRPVLKDIPLCPIQQIDDLISEEIGQKWKYLARGLNIVEGKIDEFAVRYPRLEEIVREILQYHRRKSHENYWKMELFNALDKARRKDLRIKVQDILCQQNML